MLKTSKYLCFREVPPFSLFGIRAASGTLWDVILRGCGCLTQLFVVCKGTQGRVEFGWILEGYPGPPLGARIEAVRVKCHSGGLLPGTLNTSWLTQNSNWTVYRIAEQLIVREDMKMLNS